MNALSDVEGDESADNTIMPIEYADEDDEMLIAESEEVEVDVAADTGAVAHVVGPKHLPRATPLKMPAHGRLRNFVSANNGVIKNHGVAEVLLEQENGKQVINNMNVAEGIIRPLHSVSTICDENHEMLFTKHEGIVVPEGTFSKFIASLKLKPITTYPRRGGLYVARMKARAPRARTADAPKPGAARPAEAGFGRQGRSR